MKYRPEIDGLRALAVIPVILFHAGFTVFSGGYVGVDIFFVISGYLITTIILVEKDNEGFTLVGFYERRARRILPALFFVTLCCLPFAWFWMLPSQLKDFSASITAAFMFVSNFLFWKESGYFAPAAELKPLLHTWSLAIEEQFYVIYPVFIILFWKLGKRVLVSLISLGLLFSLALAQFGGNINFSPPYIEPNFQLTSTPFSSFYLSPTRAFELIIGALTAFYLYCKSEGETNTNSFISQIASMSGLLLIIYAILEFNHATPFPSIYTLIPTIGAALLIVYVSPNTIVGKFLSNKTLVGIGLISYSAYLWHHPLFAFTRLRSVNEPSLWLFGFLGIISMVLAYFSWRFIERPFRDKNYFNRKQIYGSAIVASLVMVGIGFVGHFYNGYPERFSKLELAAANAQNNKTRELLFQKTCIGESLIGEFKDIKMCRFGDTTSQKVIFLHGDSHSKALFFAIDKVAKEKNYSVYFTDNRYCGPLPYIYEDKFLDISRVARCNASHQSLLHFIKETKPEMVIFVYRWTYKLYPIANHIAELGYDNGEGGKELAEYKESFAFSDNKFIQTSASKKAAVIRFVDEILEKDIPLLITYPVPETGWNIPHLNGKNILFNGGFKLQISTSFEKYKIRNSFVLNILDSIGNHPKLSRVKPAEIFCDTYFLGRCIAQVDGVPFYNDGDHLSDAGAALLTNEIFRKISKPYK
jgi:peptidoglycan/LPS O-acetylase OafA/YrhL